MKNKYEIRGDVTAIFLKKKNVMEVEILIDTEDLPLVASINTTWHINCIDIRYIYGIAKASKDGVRKHILMHRLITNCPNGLVVDHIDHNTLNNCKSNLRNVTRQENNHNIGTRKDNVSTGHRGISYADNKFRSAISVNKKRYYLGQFDNIDDAIRAFDKASAIVNQHGINFKPEMIKHLIALKNEPHSINMNSKVRNVYWDKTCWFVRIQIKNVTHRLGYYRDFDEAVNVAEEARKRLRSS